MNNNRKLEVLESIAAVAQDSAERGAMDPSVYADVFEFIVESIHSLVNKEKIAS